jgi:hypothetical protein
MDAGASEVTPAMVQVPARPENPNGMPRLLRGARAVSRAVGRKADVMRMSPRGRTRRVGASPCIPQVHGTRGKPGP